ncbi:GNAT family N-acetyltransferase [Pseudoalteromonas sp. NBT06-2]|uniref:GNAT family N-acetyltransferase n=1 Tax=Pseudoalteromonas sp. NBT06-2 TaxID=2025950 RepID=UPI000BA6F7B6|nr:GNAT family protein [Pseudoalteromonas sp. NBT06-2]PAJ72177.1 GNAT family N-acetyltransferase [Pseudoalteromonas sp. NBT06-2]
MFKPQILQSQLIKLVPMTMRYLDAYRAAGNFPEIWQHMSMNRCETKEIARNWMLEAINEMELGQQIAFVTVDKKSNQVIGSTRLFRLNKKDKSLEIGHTFITPKFQRSYVNSHAKYLMLQYAFEILNMVRVEICTNETNQQSRTAITRIGGHFEGILRKHRRSPNGEYRNTALFSITNDEWPKVKEKLLKTATQKQEFEVTISKRG